MSLTEVKQQITKHYEKLGKAEIYSLSQDVKAAIEYLVANGKPDTFKGLTRDYINSVTVLRKGMIAREKLFLVNMAFALNKSNKYYKGTRDLEGAYQSSLIGMMRGVEKYDSSKGFAITTYLDAWIFQAVSIFNLNEITSFKVPAYLLHLKAKIKATATEFAVSGRPVTYEALSAHLDVSEDKIKLALGLMSEVSADEPMLTGDTVTKLDNIANPEVELDELHIPENLDPLTKIIYGDLILKIVNHEQLTPEEHTRVKDQLKTLKN